ncbi:MAG: DUF6569 family protein, partial [Bacteroidota bacterium]
MKKLFILSAFFTVTFACNVENSEQTHLQKSEATDFSVNIDYNAELDYENLRIYPIVATEAFVDAHTALASMKNIEEGLQTKGFRIMEKKPYGRFEDRGAVNNLTVQNKSDDPVYLMAGDVVQGGRQDRVIAEDAVIAARSFRDIPVYCVEQGRWSFQNESENEVTPAKGSREVAFTGYYNVASNDLRRTVKYEQNQQKVWDKVSELSSINNASSATSAYAGLEQAEDFKTVRDQYLWFFGDKFDRATEERVVGIVAVSGHKVLGTDLFSHPTLFQKQYKALLHAYAIDAISNGKKVNISEEHLQRYCQKMI